ncbi:MAG: hypothetical protein NTY02_19185, partial [Acidobacteria bacterium]|nr:hypothetical protein [Acidobacteriota bacterium]
MKRWIVRACFVIAFGLLWCVPASAQRPDSPEALKQQDIERARQYDTLRDTPLLGAHATPPLPAQALPADADDDGMPDAWETAQGLNPGDPDDAWRDPDGDGVVNLFEYQLGSDPRSPATPLVKTVGPTGANYTSVATALNAVARGTLLRVAGGSYLVNYTNFSAKVVMIQGGWSPDFRQRDLRLYPTEFDGALRGEILYFSPGSGESAIVLDGLRFVRGNGFFGAVNLLAQGSSVMRTSILSCSIAGSFAGGADSVLNM